MNILKHVGNVIATMTKRKEIKDLYREVLAEMDKAEVKERCKN